MADEPAVRNGEPELTKTDLEALLTYLDPDREKSALRYEEMRQALRLFAERKGCHDGLVIADKTLDRVARNLANGLVVEKEWSYFRAVAVRVLSEYWRGPAARSGPINGDPPDEPRNHEAARKEAEVKCLDQCLASLDPMKRSALEQYVLGPKGSRQKLADGLAMTLNNLRVWKLRELKKLKACVEECLKKLQFD
jgi:DNA-directed RNA polymerase specialized sigma24 family protein